MMEVHYLSNNGNGPSVPRLLALTNIVQQTLKPDGSATILLEATDQQVHGAHQGSSLDGYDCLIGTTYNVSTITGVTSEFNLMFLNYIF
jgi:hypothetical protein